MLEIILLTIVAFLLFSLLLALNHFKKEMEDKMQYKDYVDDAIDGVYNDFRSNNTYSFPFTLGLAFYKDENGISIKSQSKLYGPSIEHWNTYTIW